MVDDGSTDETVSCARSTSALVQSLPSNQGKAAAMAKGVEAARNEIIFFLDADIHGLDEGGITKLIEPVLTGRNVMYVAIRDRHVYVLNRLLRFSPILGGERVLTRSLWERVPEKYKTRFQIEIAMNYYAKRTETGMDFSLVPGLNHVKKEKKWGFCYGLYRRMLMLLDLLIASSSIYIFDPIRQKFHPQNRAPVETQ